MYDIEEFTELVLRITQIGEAILHHPIPFKLMPEYIVLCEEYDKYLLEEFDEEHHDTIDSLTNSLDIVNEAVMKYIAVQTSNDKIKLSILEERKQ